MRRIPKVLVVGKGRDLFGTVRDVSRIATVEVVACEQPAQAWTLASRADCIVAVWPADLMVIADLEVARRARRGRIADIVVVGTHPPVYDAIEAFRAGVRDYLLRPVSAKEMESALLRCTAYRKRIGSCLATRLDDFVERGCVDPELSMESIARHFGVSTAYVGRLFREHLGMTLRVRLREERVRRAKDLLIETDKPLKVIAAACGFRSPSRFSATFSSVVGMAPRSFRHSVRSRAGWP